VGRTLLSAAFDLPFHPNEQSRPAGRPYIDMFEAVLMRENRQKGFFVCFDFTSYPSAKSVHSSAASTA